MIKIVRYGVSEVLRRIESELDRLAKNTGLKMEEVYHIQISGKDATCLRRHCESSVALRWANEGHTAIVYHSVHRGVEFTLRLTEGV